MSKKTQCEFSESDTNKENNSENHNPNIPMENKNLLNSGYSDAKSVDDPEKLFQSINQRENCFAENIKPQNSEGAKKFIKNKMPTCLENDPEDKKLFPDDSSKYLFSTDLEPTAKEVQKGKNTSKQSPQKPPKHEPSKPNQPPSNSKANSKYVIAPALDYQKLFLKETSNYLLLHKQYKSLFEDMKYHIEYINILESKLKKADEKYMEVFKELHSTTTRKRLENLKMIYSYADKLKEEKEKGQNISVPDKLIIYTLETELQAEREKSSRLMNTITAMQDEKDELSRNLTLTRTQLLDLSSKIEDGSIHLSKVQKFLSTYENPQ